MNFKLKKVPPQNLEKKLGSTKEVDHDHTYYENLRDDAWKVLMTMR